MKPHPWLRRHWRPITILFALTLAGGGALAWQLTRPAPAPTATVTPTPTPSPTPSPTPLTLASPLTGLQVDPSVAARPIIGLIIENHPDARPQAGLADAGVVYEALAEGGITRFEAFYLDQLPAVAGPIRSLRTYFLDWGLEFGAPVAHAGGNMDALDQITPTGLKNIDYLLNARTGFYRSTDRVAPHNLYTTSNLIANLLTQFNYTTPATFTPSPRKPDSPTTDAPHPNIHIDYSYNGYQVDYAYNPITNTYARSLAGAPHLDATTGKQIMVKNIVVEYMPTSYGTTRIGESTVIMQTVGQGQGVVLRDGQAIPCTWSKASRTARTHLLDTSGKDIPLNAGNTWYSIVPVGKTVSY